MYSKETKTDYAVGLICSYIYICTLLLTPYINLQCPQQQPGTNLCGFYACKIMSYLAEYPAIYDSRKLPEVSLVSQSLSFTRTSHSDFYIIHVFQKFAAEPLPESELLGVRKMIYKLLRDHYIEGKEPDFSTRFDYWTISMISSSLTWQLDAIVFHVMRGLWLHSVTLRYLECTITFSWWIICLMWILIHCKTCSRKFSTSGANWIMFFNCASALRLHMAQLFYHLRY